MPQAGQEATSTHKPVTKCPENISETGYKCVYLNARSIVNNKNELNIMVEDINSHIIGINESWANKDISDAELRLTIYVMFMRDKIGRRGGRGESFYILRNLFRLMRQKTACCSKWGGFKLENSFQWGTSRMSIGTFIILNIYQ